jgi:hypothetical protein
MQRQGNRFHPATVPLAAAAVEFSVAIQGFSPIAVHGCTDAIVVSNHGSKIADEESHLIRILCPPEERDDAPFTIAAVHPLESRRLEIHLVQ